MHIKIFKKIINNLFSDIISYINVRIVYPFKYPGSTILSPSSKNIIHNHGLILKEGVYISNSLKKLGKHVYIGNQTSILDCEFIGNYTCISQGVKIGLTNHPMDHIGVSKLFYSKERNWVSKDSFNGLSKGLTTIGHDVLISANVLILTGVNIGNGAIIGAGAVVTKDVPPFAIVTGVPGKVIGYRFNQKIIDNLLDLKWWDWEDHKLINMNPFFPNVPYFISKQEQKISRN